MTLKQGIMYGFLALCVACGWRAGDLRTELEGALWAVAAAGFAVAVAMMLD